MGAIFVLTLRAFMAVMLITAGAAKLTDRKGFTDTLIGLGIPVYRGRAILALSRLVPLVELLLGFLVISALWQAITDAAVLMLMIIFVAIAFIGILKAPDTTCRCFGALNAMRFDRNLLLRNIGITSVSLLIFWGDNSVHIERLSLGLDVILAVEYVMLVLVAISVVEAIRKIGEARG